MRTGARRLRVRGPWPGNGTTGRAAPVERLLEQALWDVVRAIAALLPFKAALGAVSAGLPHSARRAVNVGLPRSARRARTSPR